MLNTIILLLVTILLGGCVTTSKPTIHEHIINNADVCNDGVKRMTSYESNSKSSTTVECK